MTSILILATIVWISTQQKPDYPAYARGLFNSGGVAVRWGLLVVLNAGTVQFPTLTEGQYESNCGALGSWVRRSE